MRTTEVLSVTLPSPMLKEARDLAKVENRTMSELVREALRQYQQRKRWETIATFGPSSAAAANARDEQDVLDAIHQFRQERRGRKTAGPHKPARKTA